MDTHALKLEVLEKLAALNDQNELEEVKHIHDGTDGFELSDAQVSVVNKRFEAYQRGEARTYTWDEVQRMLHDERQHDRPRA